MKMTAKEERERRREERSGKSRAMAKQLQGAVSNRQRRTNGKKAREEVEMEQSR